MVVTRCGEGTVLGGGECVSPAVTCGRGTQLRDKLCQPEIDLMGNASRFTLVRIDEPSYAAQLLTEDLKGYATGQLLYLVGVHDPFGTEPYLYGGPGQRQQARLYALDRERSFAVSAVQAGDTISGDLTEMSLPVTIDDMLTLSDAAISSARVGYLYGAGRDPVLLEGDLTGVIRPQAADAVDIGGLSLRTLLDNEGVEPNIDFDEDGNNESWLLTGSFEAEPVWMF